MNITHGKRVNHWMNLYETTIIHEGISINTQLWADDAIHLLSRVMTNFGPTTQILSYKLLDTQKGISKEQSCITNEVI